MMIIIGLAAWPLTIFLAFFFFDRLLRFEYTNFRGNWERDTSRTASFGVPAKSELDREVFGKTLGALLHTSECALTGSSSRPAGSN